MSSLLLCTVCVCEQRHQPGRCEVHLPQRQWGRLAGQAGKGGRPHLQDQPGVTVMWVFKGCNLPSMRLTSMGCGPNMPRRPQLGTSTYLDGGILSFLLFLGKRKFALWAKKISPLKKVPLDTGPFLFWIFFHCRAAGFCMNFFSWVFFAWFFHLF